MLLSTDHAVLVFQDTQDRVRHNKACSVMDLPGLLEPFRPFRLLELLEPSATPANVEPLEPVRLLESLDCAD